MNEQAVSRIQHLARIFFLWAIVIAGRLVQLQMFDHGEYKRLALRQQEKFVEVQAPRGEILDREGQPLAMSALVDSVCVNPMRVPDIAVAAHILASTLHLDETDLLIDMRDAADEGRGFMWVKRRISEQESQSLHSLKLDWIEFRTEYQRIYPDGSLAAQVVGSVDFDQNGNAGVEQSFNDELEGHDGELRLSTDVHRTGFDSRVEDKPQPGHAVRLTIDSRIQRVAERELQKTIEEHHCKYGSLIVMDPKTGDILAMANYPTFDPNQPAKPGSDLSGRRNLAITTPFEPGSVFKVVTLSTALETTRLRPDTIINCGNGAFTLFGRTIHDHERYSALSMEDVLVHSSNIGAVHVGMTIGAPKLYEYIRRFRFGQRTGIQLPGESPGLVHRLKAWQPTSIGSVPMGHEIMVTTLQLAQACSIVANNGFYVKPRISFETSQAAPVAVIKPQTAITMRSMMEQVVLRGTGKNARLQRYTVGGKTGTAQMVDLKTHRYTHYYNSSFMGFIPVSNPRIVIVATASGATGNAGYGAEVSAPVFKEVALTALRVLDIPPDLPETDQPLDNTPVNTDDLSVAGLGPDPNLEPDDPDPAQAGAPTNAAAPATAAKLDASLQIGPKVPNFAGMTMRAVAEQSAALGIPVEFIGTGIVRAQVPPAGSVLQQGESVRVQFRR